MRKTLMALAILLLSAIAAWPQAKLSVQWEELTAEDFRNAVQQPQGACVFPFGILGKHGPHLPLGTGKLNSLRRPSTHWIRGLNSGAIHGNHIAG